MALRKVSAGRQLNRDPLGRIQRLKYFILGIVSVAALSLLVMNTIATVCISRTRQLTLGQKIGQLVFVWCLPFVGAMLATHLLAESDPTTVYRRWFPSDTINAYVLQVLTFQARETLRAARWSAEDELIEVLTPQSEPSTIDHSTGSGGEGD